VSEGLLIRLLGIELLCDSSTTGVFSRHPLWQEKKLIDDIGWQIGRQAGGGSNLRRHRHSSSFHQQHEKQEQQCHQSIL
jgi:hypothetical protein